MAVLAAVAVRFVTPAGWMPNPNGAGGPAFVICMADGPHLARGIDLPAPAHDHDAGHDHCLFAGFALVGAPELVSAPVPPVSVVAEADGPAVRPSLWRPADEHRPQLPRGPPREV